MQVRAASLAVPVATFVLGVLAQQLLQDYLASRDAVELGLLIVALCVAATVILIGLQTRAHARGIQGVHDAISIQSDQTAQALARLAVRSGLAVEYVDDAGVGSSYTRAAEVIRNASESLTFVDLWEPFEGYQSEETTSDADDTRPAREDYYAAIEQALERHKNGDRPFHRRVIQVPLELVGERIPFEVDPPFEEYLCRISQMQESYPLACRLRVAPALIRTHFIIVDQRVIIMPILSHDVATQEQRRYGALFFEDTSSSLYGALRHMYQVIDARSVPLQVPLRQPDRPASTGTPATSNDGAI